MWQYCENSVSLINYFRQPIKMWYVSTVVEWKLPHNVIWAGWFPVKALTFFVKMSTKLITSFFNIPSSIMLPCKKCYIKKKFKMCGVSTYCREWSINSIFSVFYFLSFLYFFTSINGHSNSVLKYVTRDLRDETIKRFFFFYKFSFSSLKYL